MYYPAHLSGLRGLKRAGDREHTLRLIVLVHVAERQSEVDRSVEAVPASDELRFHFLLLHLLLALLQRLHDDVPRAALVAADQRPRLLHLHILSRDRLPGVVPLPQTALRSLVDGPRHHLAVQVAVEVVDRFLIFSVCALA